MQSSEHFLANIPVTALALSVVRTQWSRGRLALVGLYGLALGVAIDLDHLLLARVYAGDWRHLEGVLRNPIAAVTDQEGMFDDVRDMKLPRLLSHVLIGGVLVGLTRRFSKPVGFVTAVVLYWHLLCDLLRDNRIV